MTAAWQAQPHQQITHPIPRPGISPVWRKSIPAHGLHQPQLPCYFPPIMSWSDISGWPTLHMLPTSCHLTAPQSFFSLKELKMLHVETQRLLTLLLQVTGLQWNYSASHTSAHVLGELVISLLAKLSRSFILNQAEHIVRVL